MTNLIRSNFQDHPFHLVSPSPWPLYTSISLFSLTVNGALSMHLFNNSYITFYLSLITLIASMSFWFRDIISEGTYLGNHTLAVQKGLNLGVILFIVSEGLFFVAIFWAFFHSALTPTVELGAQWPPMGIEPVNPFELPLLNTVILLSSGATITYAHHSLIKGERKGALYGSIFTVLLALIFTFFQGVEYSVSSFTISDGVFGTCFFFGTGFHGLILVALFIYINILFNTKKTYTIKSLAHNIQGIDKLLITLPESKDNYSIDKQFIEWLVGFTDAEGNFNLKLTDLKDNTFKYVQYTYQISLHEDDIEVLKYIMNTLKCGHISRSKGKANYFVNDLNSLLYIIIPIFNYVNLNSSKYHHFVSFAKAVELKRENKKLSDAKKLEIIKLQKEMQNMSGKWIPNSISDKIQITKFWLAGFIDGEATFSTNKYIPRFKLENNIKELELYNKIREFLTTGKVLYTSSRKDKNPTIVLELNKIQDLKGNLIPLMYNDGNVILKTLKHKDFLLWLKLVDLYYNGYHTILEGKFIFDAIKLHMNKYRLTTNSNLLKDKKFISMVEIYNLMSKLYLTDSPYEIKDNNRFYRNTDKLVSESTKIIAIKDNQSKMYNSISECAKDISISRKYIKECLISGKFYKDYTFVLN